MRRSAVFVVAVVLAGCPDPNDPLNQPIPTGPDEGRLLATGFVADGTFLEHGIYDNLLEIDCHPRRDAFGVLRCLPSSVPTELRYADQACTRPRVVAYLGEDAPAPKFATAGGECGGGARVYQVGYELNVQPAFEIIEGRCQRSPYALTSARAGPAGSLSVPGYGRVFEARRIEPKHFVQLTDVEESVSGGLTRRVLAAPDSKRFDSTLSWRGQSCWMIEADGGYRCGPSVHVSAWYLADNCESDDRAIMTGQAQQCGSEASEFAWLQTDEASCLGERALVRFTEEISAEALYTKAGDQCHEWPLNEGWSDGTVRRFETVDRSVLPLVEQTTIGTDRIAVRAPAIGGVAATRYGQFYDRDLESACFGRSLGGTHRCVPPSMFVWRTPMYRDAQCRDGVRVAAWHGGEPPAFVFDDESDVLYERGERIDTPNLFAKEIDGRCVAVATDCFDFFTIGAPVDPSRFVPVEEVRR